MIAESLQLAVVVADGFADALVLAFLNVGPLSNGHTLVIPKEPAVTLDMLSDAYEITEADLKAALARQGTTLEPGDAVHVRRDEFAVLSGPFVKASWGERRDFFDTNIIGAGDCEGVRKMHLLPI